MWIQTYSGKKFSFTDPQPDSIDIQDIAHSLAHICRFNGHCTGYWSVANHSMLVSQLVPEKLAGQGFAHDFAEAVTGDIPNPLKRFLKELCGPELDKFFKKIERMFAHKFGIAYPFDTEIKHADLVALATEKRDLMAKEPEAWIKLPQANREELSASGPEPAKWMFLKRYRALQKEGLIL